MRARTESALLLAAAALVCAFVASFALGMFAEDPDADEPAVHIADPPPAAPARVQPGEAVARVEVLNASGVSGLARRATDALRSAGFDVVFFGNAGAATASAADSGSVVIDRIGDIAQARAVAQALGIARIVTDADSSLLLDATVVLAEDWPQPADSTRQ